MEANHQNFNQYFPHQQHYATYIPMNTPIQSQLGHPYNQFYGFPNLFQCPNYALPQQMIYHPSSFIPQQSSHLVEQNANFFSEDTSQADIERLLLETIPDLDGTEGNFEIRKFFKKFDAYLQDWSEKRKIFALKSKLYGKAKSFFILAIKSKRYNYKSIKNFILCQLLPSEYKVEESIDLIKKRTNSPQQKKNLKGHENNSKPQKIPTPSFKNKVNIKFEKEEFSKEILEFFEMPINQDSAKKEIELENLEKGKLMEDLVIVEKDVMDEKELNVESSEDFGKEQFCELDEELVCSFDGKQELTSVEIPIPTEIHVFQEIVRLDIPVSHEEIKEEIACSESEKCFDLEKVGETFVGLKERVGEVCDDLKEFGKEECDLKEKVNDECVNLKVLGEGGKKCDDLEEKESEVYFELKGMNEYRDDLEEISEEKVDEKGILESKLEVFEKDPEKEILPTRDKLENLKENGNIVEKGNMLRSKLRKAKILARLRCEVSGNEILRKESGKDFEYGFFKRKITGRFFLGVRRCLNSKKLITLIRAPKLFMNFPKEIDHQMQDLKPMKVLYFVSVTKQDVIRESKSAEIEKDWKKRKRKEEKGLVESVSVTEFLTIGVLLETFHRRSGSVNRVGLENLMITLTQKFQEQQKNNLATQDLSGKQAEMEELILTSRTPSSEASGM
uniref:Uncharacterized protein n=2 Tax=Meloidogyne TaxID=189290 RepID=A0A6V7UKE3_MELEN|nr:unnamed protein product [Meloidogyne enterolobii]